MEIDSNVPNSPKPGDTFFVRMNNGVIRELSFIIYIFHKNTSIDTAEILETRTVDGTEQQEYFVHYLNCKSDFLV
jgi:hypothetical protein